MPPCHWAGHWAVPAPGPRTGPATGAQHLQTHPRVKHRQGELLGFISKWSTCFATASHHPPAPYALPVFSSNPDLQKQNSNFMPVHRELLAFSRLCRIWMPLPPTSFTHAVIPFVCALSCPYRTQISSLPFQIVKSASKNQPRPLVLPLKYLLISEVGFLFWITVVCNELSRCFQQRNLVQFPLLPSKWKTCWCKLTQYDISWKDHFISIYLYLPLHAVITGAKLTWTTQSKRPCIFIQNPLTYSLPLNCIDLKASSHNREHHR